MLIEIGCFSDNADKRILPKKVIHEIVCDHNSRLTPLYCSDTCIKRGYAYAGTQVMLHHSSSSYVRNFILRYLEAANPYERFYA